MNRRGFFGGLLAAFGTLLVSKKQYVYGGGTVTGYTNFPNRAVPHYFDWSLQVPQEQWPFTSDPEYAGKLEYGLQNVVTVDGKEINRAVRFVTGPNGWVEESPWPHEFEIYELATGKIVETEPKWQIHTPNPNGGEPIKKYGERLKTIIHRGNVVFRIDESRRASHGDQANRRRADNEGDGKGQEGS